MSTNQNDIDDDKKGDHIDALEEEAEKIRSKCSMYKDRANKNCCLDYHGYFELIEELNTLKGDA